METQYITLSHERAKTVLHAVQGESNARTFVFALIGASGEQVALSSDHKAYFYIENRVQLPARIDIVNNTVSITLPAQATARSGNHICTLQVYNSAEDIWRGDMVLSVEYNPASTITDDPMFIPLTEILQNAENIDRILKSAKDVNDLFADTLDKYLDGISPDCSGNINEANIPAGEVNSNGIAFDTAGNILWVDYYTNGSSETKISYDNMRTFTNCNLAGFNNNKVHFCIGGDKFLLFAGDYMMWVQTMNNSVTTDIKANPLSTNVSPTIRHGKYLKNKYWVFRNEGNSIFPAAYFTGIGTNYVIVNLPDAAMDAHDIAYDKTSGYYYMVGGYSPYGRDAGKSWLLKSDDLIYWEPIKEWVNNAWYEYRISIVGDMLNVIRLKSYNNTGIAHRMDLKKSIWVDWMPPFTVIDVASTPLGDVLVGDKDIAFTKNGIDFPGSLLNFDQSEMFTKAAGFGKIVAVTKGTQYEIYKIDLAGEKMIASLERAKDEYDTLAEELAAAAGRKIICTSMDPGAGADIGAPDGTIIFVYE